MFVCLEIFASEREGETGCAPVDGEPVEGHVGRNHG